MTKEHLIWLYEFIIKQTEEVESVYHPYFWGENQLEKEVNRLLLKYNCEPLNGTYSFGDMVKENAAYQAKEHKK